MKSIGRDHAFGLGEIYLWLALRRAPKLRAALEPTAARGT
jgi:hypothetical protein